MPGVNKVILIGNLGDDPEQHALHNGGTVTKWRMATSESWKDRDGNRQERTEWHSVVTFNEGLGKVVMDYCRKGSKLYVLGKLQTRKWQDQAGADRYSTEIVLGMYDGEVVLLDSKGRDDRDDSRGAPRGNGRRTSGDGRGRDEPRQESFGNDYERDNFGPIPERQPQRQRPQPATFDSDLDDDVPF